MPAAGELAQLAARKAVVRFQIAAARRKCEAGASGIVPMLDRADALWTKWKLVSPFLGLARIPFRTVFRRHRRPTLIERASTVIRWGPLVARAVQAVAELRSR